MEHMHRLAITSLGVVSLVGCISVAVSDGVGILLRPGYNPLSQSVSSLALGPTGWVQGVGLGLGAIGTMACAVGLYMALPRAWEAILGEVFLLFAGMALLMTALFRSGSPGVMGNIHMGSSFAAAIVFLPGCFLISPALRKRRGLFLYTIAAGVLQIALEVGRGTLPENWMFFGLHERLIGANALAWVAALAWIVLIGYRTRWLALDSRYAR